MILAGAVPEKNTSAAIIQIKIMAEQSNGENLSGKYLKKEDTVRKTIETIGHPYVHLTKREKIAQGTPLSSKEKREFLTPEKLALARDVFASLNNRLGSFGINIREFSPDIIELFNFNVDIYGKNKGTQSIEIASINGRTGRIKLPAYQGMTNEEFVKLLLHEGAHFFQTRVFGKRDAIYAWYVEPEANRMGLQMDSGKDKVASIKDILSRYGIDPNDLDLDKEIRVGKFRLLTEGVVEKTAREIYDDSFISEVGNEKSTINVSPYGKIVEFIENLCTVISSNEPEKFPGNKDAFILFQRATFGKGDLRPLIRAFEKLKGMGAFTEFSKIMAFADYAYFQNERKPWEVAKVAMDHYLNSMRSK